MKHSKQERAGFTLLELLTVLAVIAILAALLFPGITAARHSALIAKTRVQFTQWAAAIEGFRQEYGYYPVLSDTHLVNPSGQSNDPVAEHRFHDLLAARRRNGAALPSVMETVTKTAPQVQNYKRIPFHIFNDGDFDEHHWIRDAAGNTAIAVLVDSNLDGVIEAGRDYDILPSVAGLTPGVTEVPPTGVRAGVIFYAPAPNASLENPEFIFSWR